MLEIILILLMALSSYVYKDDPKAPDERDIYLEDDFQSENINAYDWRVSGNTAYIEDGHLVLTSDSTKNTRSEVIGYILYPCSEIEIKAFSTHWASPESDIPISTSLGFEFRRPRNHLEIQICNGTIGIVEYNYDTAGGCTLPIPDWELLKTRENIFRILVSGHFIDFYINDVKINKNDLMFRSMDSGTELKIILVCDVQIDSAKRIEKDALKIDYVVVKE
jgi:hypothetical protein